MVISNLLIFSHWNDMNQIDQSVWRLRNLFSYIIKKPIQGPGASILSRRRRDRQVLHCISEQWLMNTPIRLHNKCWVLCFLGRLSLSCRVSSFSSAWLTFERTALFLRRHGVTCCQLIWFFRTQSGRSSKGMIAFVRRCPLSFPKMMTHSNFMQIIFVWLVICSRSSSLIRIDDTLLDRTAELRIRSCGDDEHVLPSCSYLCHNGYQPLFWLVCGLFVLNVGKLYHCHINKHPRRVARVCILPLHITYFVADFGIYFCF